MSLKSTDPEFIERFEHFAFEEVVNEENCHLDTETRYIAVFAALIGCGVTIGDNAVIGAVSVIIMDVPENMVAAGVPARVIKSIFEEDT